MSMQRLFVAAQKLLDKKSEDYNTEESDAARSEYFPYGDVSYVQMLHVKFKRIETLALFSEGKKTNFESIEDSLVDLISYASFYYEYLQQQKADGHDPEGEELVEDKRKPRKDVVQHIRKGGR